MELETSETEVSLTPTRVSHERKSWRGIHKTAGQSRESPKATLLILRGVTGPIRSTYRREYGLQDADFSDLTANVEATPDRAGSVCIAKNGAPAALRFSWSCFVHLVAPLCSLSYHGACGA